MNGKLWLDGQLVDADKALAPVMSRGWTVGYGVFETLVAYDGETFALARHYRRLVASAQVLGLAVPDLDVLRDACASVLAANAPDAARARVRITIAEGLDAAVTAITAAPSEEPAPVTAVVVSPHTRNPDSALAGVKATSYAENTLALAKARTRGADEAILANTAGRLCEGTTSNVFLVRDGTLLTPPLSSGCLAGVTRELVLELAGDAGIPFSEEDLPIDALTRAGEAFLTSTLREVQPIANVEGKDLSSAPGDVTRRLQEAFRALRESETDP